MDKNPKIFIRFAITSYPPTLFTNSKFKTIKKLKESSKCKISLASEDDLSIKLLT